MNRILIVEDIAETSRWLAAIAAGAYPGAAIDQVRTLGAALALVAQDRFDLALIDIGLPDGSGLDVLRAIRTKGDPTILVVTTVLGDDTSVVAALSAGAEGYLLKENPADVLTHQLRQLTAGVPALSPAIARRIMQHFRYTGPMHAPDLLLTRRETEVLALIARGLRNAEAAAALGLTENTVAGYIKGIYRKLGISSRAEASWHATQMGLSHDPGSGT